MQNFGEDSKPLTFDVETAEAEEQVPEVSTLDAAEAQVSEPQTLKKVDPPKQDEFLWAWKVSTIPCPIKILILIVMYSTGFTARAGDFQTHILFVVLTFSDPKIISRSVNDYIAVWPMGHHIHHRRDVLRSVMIVLMVCLVIF